MTHERRMTSDQYELFVQAHFSEIVSESAHLTSLAAGLDGVYFNSLTLREDKAGMLADVVSLYARVEKYGRKPHEIKEGNIDPIKRDTQEQINYLADKSKLSIDHAGRLVDSMVRGVNAALDRIQTGINRYEPVPRPS